MSPDSAGENAVAKTLASAMRKALDSAESEGSVVVDTVALQIVNRGQLAQDQAHCPDMAEHRKGNHSKSITITDFQLSPGIWLYCDV